MPEEDEVSDVKAKVKEKVGWATGDRRVEAEGRAGREGDQPVEEAEEEVRQEHGDID